MMSNEVSRKDLYNSNPWQAYTKTTHSDSAFNSGSGDTQPPTASNSKEWSQSLLESQSSQISPPKKYYQRYMQCGPFFSRPNTEIKQNAASAVQTPVGRFPLPSSKWTSGSASGALTTPLSSRLMPKTAHIDEYKTVLLESIVSAVKEVHKTTENLFAALSQHNIKLETGHTENKTYLSQLKTETEANQQHLLKVLKDLENDKKLIRDLEHTLRQKDAKILQLEDKLTAKKDKDEHKIITLTQRLFNDIHKQNKKQFEQFQKSLIKTNQQSDPALTELLQTHEKAMLTELSELRNKLNSMKMPLPNQTLSSQNRHDTHENNPSFVTPRNTVRSLKMPNRVSKHPSTLEQNSSSRLCSTEEDKTNQLSNYFVNDTSYSIEKPPKLSSAHNKTKTAEWIRPHAISAPTPIISNFITSPVSRDSSPSYSVDHNMINHLFPNNTVSLRPQKRLNLTVSNSSTKYGKKLIPDVCTPLHKHKVNFRRTRRML